MSEVPNEFCPRLSHVVKWPEFQGYGFNLHAEKGKAGQYIGKVDANSPAEAAGLKEGDRIVEVNGVNIGVENHQQVVGRIKSGGDETRMLVVDTESDNYYKEQKKVVKGDLPEVRHISAARDVEEETQEEEAAESPREVTPEPEPEHIVAEVAAVNLSEPVNGINGDFEHRPRLCHLKLWPHFQGYGFNLHAERDKPGQFIGLVDDNSPASTAGMRVNDRIIEVNGTNIEQQNHTEVIGRIKAVQGETKLLVLDRESDIYYREKGITVSSDMEQTEYKMSTEPDAVNGNGNHSEPEPQYEEPEYTVVSHQKEAPAPRAPEVIPEPEPTKPAADPVGADLSLNLSVAEMKERLKSKKKKDPRSSTMTFEQKYKEFQRF